jgi:hypothetical protein
MIIRKIISLSLFVILLFNFSLISEDNPKPDIYLMVGEELQYKVKYSVFTLGSLKFQILDRDTLNGRPVYHCILYIESNPSLPFVNINDIYESWMDEDIYSHKFISYEKKSDQTLITQYDMNYKKNVVHIIEKIFTETDTVLQLDSVAVLDTDRKIQDGLTLLFYARAMSKYNKKISVPIFAFNELKYTFINFTGETDKVEAAGEKYKAYFLDGWLKFVGIAGIKEGFKGWFSADKQRIPLKAHMEAFLGHVTLKLDSYSNWDHSGS